MAQVEYNPVKLPFTKMHGCGNDFAVFADPENRFGWDGLSELARRLCPRRYSIGADGIIAVGQSPLPGDEWPVEANYEMRYVNADGSRAEMCGNGIRCVARFVAEQFHDPRPRLNVLTGFGVLAVDLLKDGEGVAGRVAVRMGTPNLLAARIPTTLAYESDQVIAADLVVGEEKLAVTAVNMGNPHAVAFVDEITDHHVHRLGPQAELHPAFPEKTNVEFVQVLSPTHLRMRVWERGVGETMACGTGACASVVAAVLNGHSLHDSAVTVTLNGGDLEISWPGEGSAVQMIGPAEVAYRGEVEIP